MTREECLNTAKKCVCGKRQQDYGSPEDNFTIISAYWNTYLAVKLKQDPNYILSGEDVAIMMALFKIGRITTGTGTADSFVDACGYLACGAEIVDNIRQHKPRVAEAFATATNDPDLLNKISELFNTGDETNA